MIDQGIKGSLYLMQAKKYIWLREKEGLLTKITIICKASSKMDILKEKEFIIILVIRSITRVSLKMDFLMEKGSIISAMEVS